METVPPSTDFVALGHPGSERYAGLETFANPGASHVEMTSDELTAICPSPVSPTSTWRESSYWPGPLCIESKSLKLYLNSYRGEGQPTISSVR